MADSKILKNDDIKFAPLKDDGTFPQWFKHVKTYLSKFGVAGKAILAGTGKQEPLFPKASDMVCNEHGLPTLIQKYEHLPAVLDEAGAEVTALLFINDGMKDFKRAVDKYADLVTAYNVGNNLLSSFILLHLSEDVKKGLMAQSLFTTALHKSPMADTFAMMTMIKDQFSKGTGRTVTSLFSNFLSLKQGTMSHEAFVEAIKDGELTTRANYESPLHPGYIAINDISAGIYLSGVCSTLFKYKLEHLFVNNPTGRFSDVDALMADFQLYAREHRLESTDPTQYSSALVAGVKSTGPVVQTCRTCNASVTAINPRTKKVHAYCVPCTRLFNSQRQSVVKPGPVVAKPTAAQLLAARALVAADDSAEADDF